MRISDWSSDVCSSDLSTTATARCRRRGCRTWRKSKCSPACRAAARRCGRRETSTRSRCGWHCRQPGPSNWSSARNRHHPGARNHHPVKLARMTEFIPPGTRWIDLPSPFPMKRGGALHGARIAYETWGTRNAAGDNTILILTGLSPDAHAAANEANPAPGWWEAMVGPGKPIDTDRWHVVCFNALGSCKGSTGPASTNPATGELYRLAFPELSIEDGADAAHAVIRALGIERLACLIGNSMGGMNALAFLTRHPGIARSHINISGAARALPFSIALRSLQREAIRLDPPWNESDSDDTHSPESGNSLARKAGLTTSPSRREGGARWDRAAWGSECRTK